MAAKGFIKLLEIAERSKKRGLGLLGQGANAWTGVGFLLSGENFSLPNGQSFPIYCLAALIPIITIKQRFTHPNDWISTDHLVACPDVNCGGVFKISRIGKTLFSHHQVTATRLHHE